MSQENKDKWIGPVVCFIIFLLILQKNMPKKPGNYATPTNNASYQQQNYQQNTNRTYTPYIDHNAALRRREQQQEQARQRQYVLQQQYQRQQMQNQINSLNSRINE